MTELYIGLAIWAVVGVVIVAIIFVSPPWMPALSEWAQITITVFSGPMVWICIACVAILVLTGEAYSRTRVRISQTLWTEERGGAQ